MGKRRVSRRIQRITQIKCIYEVENDVECEDEEKTVKQGRTVVGSIEQT